jgi:hypothetical protein
MPNPKPLSDEQQQQAIALRTYGMPYLKIACRIGASESVTFKFLKSTTTEPKPPPIKNRLDRKSAPGRILLEPTYRLNSNCPLHKRRDGLLTLEQRPPPLTKAQMYQDLALAVRNTLRLAR